MAYKIKKVNRGVERRDYRKVSGNLELPNLIEIQTKTFEWFKTKGIDEVLNEFFAMSSNDASASLFLEGWEIKEAKISPAKAKEQSKIYDAPIYVDLQLMFTKTEDISKEFEEIVEKDIKKVLANWIAEKTDSKNVSLVKNTENIYFFDVKLKGTEKNDLFQITILEEKEDLVVAEVSVRKWGQVFFGDFPLMTDAGTFVINGSQKVIVSQLVRSPGSYFKTEINNKTGENLYNGDIIPSRGTWLEFETDTKKTAETTNSLFVKIDKSRKTTATSFLKILGLDRDTILNIYDKDKVIVETLKNDNDTGDTYADWAQHVQEIYKKIRQGETATSDGASKYINGLLFDRRKYDLTKAGRFKLQQKLAVKNRLIGRILAEDIVDANGKVLVAKNTEVSKANFKEISEALSQDGVMVSSIEYREDIPGSRQIQKVKVYQDNNSKDETFTIVGITPNSKEEHITVVDIVATVSYLLGLEYNIGEYDDIDNLANRRVRTVGELLQNQFRMGLTRIDKNVKEKLSTSDLYKVKVSTIINAKPLTAVIGEFFNLSQLSQFMDQINPLAELTNKRRLTALGPGGLSRDRASLEVRDVHPSHYGRICPIETPEGPNIGLINNLSTYAIVDELGFIRTPYLKVIDGVIQNEHEYLSADEEKEYIISQSNVTKDENGKILDETVVSRYKGDDYIAKVSEVQFIDVSPKQIVSVATSAIPFLENDDANRALMGANMQRQAVPTIVPESPFVGTGIEFEAARDSGVCIVAAENGIVKYVDAKQITVESKAGIKTYTLANFERSNNGSSIVQKPIVKVGDSIEAGQIIADGPSVDNGELALGQNVVVAFTTYNGYNFEDAIVMSERVIMEDKFTSVHIDEYVLEVRNTKQGAEEITSEIPNISDNAKKYLDNEGIVAIGTEVKTGDILVGKVTPKGQTQLSPEDKLLHAIFGEKSRSVKDNSLKVPNGGEGIVQSVKRFKAKSAANPDGIDLPADVLEVIKVYIVQKRKIQEGDKMSGRHGNKGIISKVLPVEDMPHLEDGTPVDILLNPQGIPSRMNIGQILEIHLGMAAKKLGVKIATPVFEGVNSNDLDEIMAEAGMENYGKVKLIDGQTGEAIDKPISVGVMYMLKLSHMVDDKLHARSVGPYSLITQQPLGGKAQNGGQRFGEMEVWALEAYGAAHTLREILTIKSDDLKGRTKTYEAIVRSKNIPTPGTPESFNVLSKEIMGLGFDIYLLDDKGNKSQINAYDDDNDLINDESMKHASTDKLTFEDSVSLVEIEDLDSFEEVDESEINLSFEEE
ncbi:DNA-directed RNA polymerase subunit beta [Mesoplasma entomophilum]|uniref:DNA-directed RNA polymerase subunit beta n=3 Tax=Mesoplasma TaxID=46239 RepID=A0A3S5Y0B7_9MOLU|nr:DNA-directed RNA polymerase subunit beta [Mesoplasma entomophilum]ATQ35777.1 DNA-directed RNA polymerase subunit beta [Mesoplasma entomophilum]ATZ19746.1 DNA-directed RNA polymerase subunit beta [Mesoplasma entomophilum]